MKTQTERVDEPPAPPPLTSEQQGEEWTMLSANTRRILIVANLPQLGCSPPKARRLTTARQAALTVKMASLSERVAEMKAVGLLLIQLSAGVKSLNAFST